MCTIPLNKSAVVALQQLHARRMPESPHVFPHRSGRNVRHPVASVKNAYHTALEMAKIKDFTWHDLRHTFASWPMMRGAPLSAVAELLGHRGLRMVMRYAHLSPAYLTAEIGLLDAPIVKRANKGQRATRRGRARSKVVKFPKGNGSPVWTTFATGSSVRPRDAPFESQLAGRQGFEPF